MISKSKAVAIALGFSASLCKATPADPTITAPPVLPKREAYDYNDFIGNYATAGVSSSCLSILHLQTSDQTTDEFP